MPPLRWTDADEIGRQLHQAYPRTDPLSVRFTDLYRLVTSLKDFAGAPSAASEALLEAIQMAWLECFRDDA